MVLNGRKATPNNICFKFPNSDSEHRVLQVVKDRVQKPPQGLAARCRRPLAGHFAGHQKPSKTNEKSTFSVLILPKTFKNQ